MGTSRASKDLLLQAYAANNLSKPLPVKPKKKKDPIIPDTNPNSMNNMQNTLDKTRRGGYKGANWLK